MIVPQEKDVNAKSIIATASAQAVSGSEMTVASTDSMFAASLMMQSEASNSEHIQDFAMPSASTTIAQVYS